MLLKRNWPDILTEIIVIEYGCIVKRTLPCKSIWRLTFLPAGPQHWKLLSKTLNEDLCFSADSCGICLWCTCRSRFLFCIPRKRCRYNFLRRICIPYHRRPFFRSLSDVRLFARMKISATTTGFSSTKHHNRQHWQRYTPCSRSVLLLRNVCLPIQVTWSRSWKRSFQKHVQCSILSHCALKSHANGYRSVRYTNPEK